jgi:acetoin utilization protein AcuB
VYVKHYVSTNVVTATGETPINDAQKLMQDHRLRHLPIVEDGILIGIVTEDKIREASASLVASQNVRGSAQNLGQMNVRDVMKGNVPSVAPDTTVEDALAIGRAHHLGVVPVVVGQNYLVGIANMVDLYRMELEARRFGEKGTRLHLYGCSRGGPLFKEVLGIIERREIKVLCMLRATPRDGDEDHWILHLDTRDVIELMGHEILHLDIDGAEELVGELRAKGYDVEARPPVIPRQCDIAMLDVLSE